jgi:hypothetical protein
MEINKMMKVMLQQAVNITVHLIMERVYIKFLKNLVLVQEKLIIAQLPLIHVSVHVPSGSKKTIAQNNKKCLTHMSHNPVNRH